MGEFDAIIKSYNLSCCYKEIDSGDRCIEQLKNANDLVERLVLKFERKLSSSKPLFSTNKLVLERRKEVYLSKQLHVLRYHTKFTLQI